MREESGARGELEVAEKRRRTVERVLVGVHVKRVDREVVRSHVERLEHLAQREMLAVSEDDDFLLLGGGGGRRRRRVSSLRLLLVAVEVCEDAHQQSASSST